MTTDPTNVTDPGISQDPTVDVENESQGAGLPANVTPQPAQPAQDSAVNDEVENEPVPGSGLPANVNPS